MVGGADERLLSLTFPPAISSRTSLIRALFTAGRYASSAKSAFEGQKRGRCDIVMSHEERFPSPNAESALGRNCIGGALGLSLQLSWSGWSGLIWSGVVWSGLVWARLGRSG